MDENDDFDERVEELRAWLENLRRDLEAKIIDEMEWNAKFIPPPDITLRPGEVILFGFEGQVDCVWGAPEPRPNVLYRPIPPKFRFEKLDNPEYVNDIPTARYDRVGESTYQRVE